MVVLDMGFHGIPASICSICCQLIKLMLQDNEAYHQGHWRMMQSNDEDPLVVISSLEQKITRLQHDLDAAHKLKRGAAKEARKNVGAAAVDA